MRVLYIAEIASPHAAGWINSAIGADIETGIFQCTFAPTDICTGLRNYRGPIFSPKSVLGVWNSQSLCKSESEFVELGKVEGVYSETYSKFLVSVIEQFKPDAVHLLGLCVNFRNSARCLLGAARMASFDLPPLIYSSWGADLDYYPNAFPMELVSIREFLALAKYHVTECDRDIRLASELGFRGATIAKVPANGGVPLSARMMGRQCLTARRDVILVKGRDVSDGDPIGRAMTALEGLALASKELKNFRIRVLQVAAGSNVARKISALASDAGLDIEALPFLDDAGLQKLFTESLIFLANTINDGLPLSLVEAMTLGAFPIHSNLESIREYVRDGRNGTLVPSDDERKIADAIKSAVSDTGLLNRARRWNYEFVESEFAQAVVVRKMVKAYSQVTGVRPRLKRLKRVISRLAACRSQPARMAFRIAGRKVLWRLPESVRSPLRRFLDSFRG